MVLGKCLLLMVQVAPPLQGKEEHDAAGAVRTTGWGGDVSGDSQNLSRRALGFGLSCQKC